MSQSLDVMHTPQTLAEQGWKMQPMPGHMGAIGPIWMQAREDGLWRYGLLIEDKHLNPAKIVHGGVLLTLADHAMSSVAWLHRQRQPCVTVQLDSQFIGPARAGDFVVCEAHISHGTRSMMFMRAELFVKDQLVLTGQGIMKMLPPSENSAS